MAVTVVSLLSAFVDDACPTRRGEGVKRSDLVEHVAVPMIRAAWGGGDLPGLRTPLNEQTSAQVRAAMPGPSELTERVAICRLVIQRIVWMVAESQLTAAPADFSEWVAIRVGRGEADVETLARQALERHCRRGEALSRNDFVTRYGPEYDLVWERRGQANMTAWPPEELQLGRNEKPPIATTGPERWPCGTDRSVHGRYMLGFRASSASRQTKRCPNPACAQTTHPDGDPGMAEVDRACSPYGLQKSTHHVVLRSLERGYLFGVGMPRVTTDRTWASWVGGCGEVATDGEFDPDIVEAVSSAAAAFAASYVANRLREMYKEPDVLASQAAVMAFMRRAWMELHRREREHAAPVRRCWVAATTAAGLSSGIGLGMREFITSNPDWLKMAPELLDRVTDQGMGEGPFQEVCDALIEHQGLVRSMLADQPGWVDQYAAVMGRDPSFAASHPDAREFAAWLHERVGER